MKPRPRPALAPALLAGLLAAATARADFRVEFREGLRAYDRRSWAEVEARMQAALRENPKEDARETVRVSGTFSKAYLPYFYLGAAQAEQNRCAEAVRSFERSESFGQIAAFREHAELERLKARCLDVVVSDATRRIESALREADAARERLAGSAARSRLGSAWDGESTLGGEQRRLELEAGELRAAVAALAAKPELAAAERVEKRSSGLTESWRILQTLADERAAALATAPLAESAAMIPAATAAAGPAPAAPRPGRVPAALLEAVGAYFAGEYAACLARLEQTHDLEPTLAPQADLFRAAAQFALSRMDADGGARRLAEARLAARRFLSAPGRSRPDERHFPPDFLRFLAGV